MLAVVVACLKRTSIMIHVIMIVVCDAEAEIECSFNNSQSLVNRLASVI